MKNIFTHTKKYVFRGLIALIPVVLTFVIIQFLYVAIDQRVMNLVEDWLGFSVPGLGILILAGVLYIAGLITSNVIGNRIIRIIETITEKIPIIGTIYNIGKQLSTTFSLPEKQVFKRAVLVEFLREDVWTIGFVTGTLFDKTKNQTLLKVYVPTPPNPTSGFILFLREDQVRDPGWSIDAALKLTVSGGILGPDTIQDVKREKDKG